MHARLLPSFAAVLRKYRLLMPVSSPGIGESHACQTAAQHCSHAEGTSTSSCLDLPTAMGDKAHQAGVAQNVCLGGP